LLSGMSNPSLAIGIGNIRGIILNESSDFRDYFYKQNHEKTIQILGVQETKNRKLEIDPILSRSFGSEQVVSKPVGEKDGSNGKNVKQTKILGSETEQPLLGLKQKFSKSDSKNNFSDATAVLEVGTQFAFSSDPDYRETLTGKFVHSKAAPYEPGLVNDMLNQKRKDIILQWLQSIEPKIQDIMMNFRGVVMVDIGLDNFIPINLLGDGLPRILYILSCVYGTRSGVLMVDEIENGLHVSSVHNMLKMILEISAQADTQIFLTTHSNDVIKSLAELSEKSSELFPGGVENSVACFSLEKNDHDEMKAYKYSPDQIRKSLDSNTDIRH
ncbi:AAA family ATPase, partial [Candidatus Mycalebacterium sp.]